MAKNRLLTEILRPKTIDQLILPPRIKAIIGDGSLKQNFLFYGGPGLGKCVHPNTEIEIRNKKTGEIQKISIIDFFLFSKTLTDK